MHNRMLKLPESPCIVSKNRYTGEDGVELICPSERKQRRMWDALLRPGKGRRPVPCGLGARDTLP